MPVAHPERRGQLANLGARQRMLLDSGDRGADQPAHRIHRGQARRTLGTAAQTGTETCAFGARGTGEKAHVAALGGTRRTDRTAIDLGGRDGDEEAAVEAAVAGPDRAKAGIGVEFHGTQDSHIRT